jgi:hypothetical protein
MVWVSSGAFPARWRHQEDIKKDVLRDADFLCHGIEDLKLKDQDHFLSREYLLSIVGFILLLRQALILSSTNQHRTLIVNPKE